MGNVQALLYCSSEIDRVDEAVAQSQMRLWSWGRMLLIEGIYHFNSQP